VTASARLGFLCIAALALSAGCAVEGDAPDASRPASIDGGAAYDALILLDVDVTEDSGRRHDASALDGGTLGDASAGDAAPPTDADASAALDADASGDASANDAGFVVDAGQLEDASSLDASDVDASQPADASSLDASDADASQPADASSLDASDADASQLADASSLDASDADASQLADASSLDASDADASQFADASIDAGSAIDAGSLVDAASATDAGSDRTAPLVEIGDYSLTYWPTNFRPTASAVATVRHFHTGFFGFAFDVSQASLTRLGEMPQALTEVEALGQDNSIIDGFDAASVAYSIDVDGQRFDPTTFAGSDGSTSNPSQLVDGGRFMQRVEIPTVSYDPAAGVDAEVALAVMPRHFVLTHRVTATRAHNASVSVRIELDGAAVTSLNTEDWVHPQRALRLTDGADQGWVFILPESAVATGTITRGATGALEFSWEVSSLADADEVSLSVLVMPASVASAEQLDVYLNPGTSVRVEYAQLDRAGNTVAALADAPWDAERGVFLVPLGTISAAGGPNHLSWANPSHHNLYLRHRLMLHNQSGEVVSVPLAFDGAHPAVTAGVGILRDANGEPLGVPVQMSKNWHDASMTPRHWMHLYTAPVLPASRTYEAELTVAHAKWGDQYAAAHAQLSLIGWGVNQQWDESSLGAWGESITYDPDLTLRRSMVDDVRPFLVDAAGQWNWTGNVGGADFLVYVDSSGARQRMGRMRTLYRESGPNLTDVRYSGVTADQKISATMTTQLGRTDDLVRAYYHIDATVLQDVDYRRLAFFQVAADNYGDNRFTRHAYGNASGVLFDGVVPNHQTTGYAALADRGIALSGASPWVMLFASTPVAMERLPEHLADVGFVVRAYEANIGSTTSTVPHINIIRTNNRDSQMAFELGVPFDPMNPVVPAGSRVRATVEYVVPPSSKAAYYGNSDHLGALAANAFGTTDMMRSLAVGNALSVQVASGQLVRDHPPELEIGTGTVAAQLSLTGGLGLTPITFRGLARHDGWRLERRSGAGWGQVDQSVEGNDYWQAHYDAASGSYSLVFNVENRGTNEYRLVR